MAFEAWAIVELMGHARIAGKVSEVTVFGTAMMRVDVPKTNRREPFTKYYSAGSLYCLTPTDEQTAVLAAERFDEPPVQPWILPLPESPALAAKVVRDDFDSSYDLEEIEDDWGGEPDRDEGFDDEEDELDDDLEESFPEAVEYNPPAPSPHNDKLEAAKSAKQLTDGEFVIVDTETTGFSETDEIIQIAIINQDGHVLCNTFVKPTRPIPNSEYHGITDEMVKDAPTFADLYPQLHLALDGKVVVAYNYAYDSRMIEQDCSQHGLVRILSKGHECIMELYAAFYGEWNDYHGNYRWQKLHTAVMHFGLEFDGKEHDALADCKATLAVIRAMADWYDKQTILPIDTAVGDAAEAKAVDESLEASLAQPIPDSEPEPEGE